MTARDGQIAALRDIADGLDHGLPDIHAITIGMDPIRVQVNGDRAENVDRWLQFFDPAAKGAVTQRHWGSQGKDFYCGQVVIEEGATLEFWDAIPAPADDDVRAENERLRAELAALRAADVAPPAGDAVVAEVAAEATTAPVQVFGCVYDVWGADFGVAAGARCLNDDPDHQLERHTPADDLSAAVTSAEDVTIGGYWCTVNGARCTAETDPCHLCPTAADPIPADADGDLIAPVGEA